MRITVVGTALIVGAAIVVVLLIRALNDNQGRGPQQDYRSGIRINA